MPVAKTYNRHKAVDFIIYVTIEGNSISYKYPTLEPDVAGFIRPFTIEVNIRTAKKSSYIFTEMYDRYACHPIFTQKCLTDKVFIIYLHRNLLQIKLSPYIYTEIYDR